ncbi:DNA/RNA non-specific endonuclease [Lactobacillus psittaci]|uniref:DNA-entry nuclease n=1 Tax=Lactobacillus psittaci DSM 15354 TaxID=1122152 RepID=A0A0R1S463_9LACO|nr:DNA/RNA non-specific endonuclease [Lactobacillus psittaci]KRL63697.1 DNA-entry nuclease [Lactobacillus psittaci DSM 15354]
MKNRKLIISLIVTTLFLGAGISGNLDQTTKSNHPKVVTKIKYNQSEKNKADELASENEDLADEISNLKQKIKKNNKKLKKLGKANQTQELSQSNASAAKLANLNYSGQDVITVNNNNPSFSKSDLSTANGAWQRYGDLDNLNRASAANALLNLSLMPKAKREPLHVNPTGWHNKKISGGWLYNRCHLIGYQLTGQNNNWKNLITGTRQLNDPDMLKYEDQVADYIKQSSSHYVRYRVTPIFRGSELLARGVEMEGQSTGDNQVHFNVFIFNIQPGYELNYSDGTSKAA